MTEDERDDLRSYYYRRPYLDAWGNWRNPVSKWDELLKYYKPWIMLLVGEGTRRMAQPASVRAHQLIRKEQKGYQRSLEHAHQLEAQYLRKEHKRKQLKRRNQVQLGG